MVRVCLFPMAQSWYLFLASYEKMKIFVPRKGIPMKLTPYLFSFLMVLGSLSAQTTETREVPAFTMLEVGDKVVVVLIPGKTPKLEAEFYNATPDRLKTEWANNTLRITATGMLRDQRITVKLYYQQLHSIKAILGGEVRSDAPIEANKLELEAKTGGIISIKAAANIVQASVGQGSKIHINGKAEQLVADAASGGKIYADQLVTQIAAPNATSGGKIWVDARKKLDARAHSGGKVFFRTMIDDRNIRESTGGVVKYDPLPPSE